MTASRRGRIPLAAAAAGLTISLCAAASEAATWTVSPGGSFSSGRSGGLLLADTTAGATITCTSSALAGVLQAGSGLPGTKIASISAVRFSGCAGPRGPVSVTLALSARGLPWSLNATFYNAALDTAIGTLTGIHVVISGPNCRTVVDGTAARAFDGTQKFRYKNARHQLMLNPSISSLHFYDTSGCSGAFASGDGAEFSATYLIRPPQVITSP